MAERSHIPREWAQMTPGWMTTVLQSAGFDVEVAGVAVTLEFDGTNKRARLALTYVRGTGPATVFMKRPNPIHVERVYAASGLSAEPQLFHSGAHLPLEHPRVYAAFSDEPTLDFLLVMEDIVARGATPSDGVRPYTLEQAADGVRGLARLHSAFWGARLDAADMAWLKPWPPWEMEPIFTAGLNRVRHVAPPKMQAATGGELQTCWFEYMATVPLGPQTLLHGDPHIGNTYLTSDNGVGFLDWQVACRGAHMTDVAYFIQGSLAIEDRRRGERQLLAAYHAALDLPPGERPSLDDLWLRYRAAAAHGVAMWLVTAASDAFQSPEVSFPLCERHCAAFADLDTPEAIKELAREVGAGR